MLQIFSNKNSLGKFFPENKTEMTLGLKMEGEAATIITDDICLSLYKCTCSSFHGSKPQSTQSCNRCFLAYIQ
jgi:hypothetical protein